MVGKNMTLPPSDYLHEDSSSKRIAHWRTEWPFQKLERNGTDGEVARSFRSGHSVRHRLGLNPVAAFSLAGF